MSKYSEVRADYYDEVEDKLFLDKDARTDVYAQEIIQAVLNDYY